MVTEASVEVIDYRTLLKKYLRISHIPDNKWILLGSPQFLAIEAQAIMALMQEAIMEQQHEELRINGQGSES